MYLFSLLLFVLFLKETIACVENVPSYLDGGWMDDQIIPDWKLKHRTGDTNMLLLMRNYTFTCSGRLTTWYLWWRVNGVVQGCEVNFTLYVLRPPLYHTDCGTAVVGSHLQKIRFYGSSFFVSRRPQVLEDVEDVWVQEGDYIALQISIGSKCGTLTEAWLRGRADPNAVSLRTDGEYISPNFGCEVQPFTLLETGVGFISALVVSPTESASTAEATRGIESIVLSNSRASEMTAAAPVPAAITTTKPAESLGPTKPAASPGPTEPAASPGPTEPAASLGQTKPAASPGPTEPATSPGPTKPAASPGPTEPAASPGPTKPAASPGPTEPAESPGPTKPAELSPVETKPVEMPGIVRSMGVPVRNTPMGHSETVVIGSSQEEVMPTPTASTLLKHPSIGTTMAGETSKAVERTSTAGETRTAVETNPAVGRAGMSLENFLLLVIMGSLVLSAVMVATCLMGVAIQLCRKSRTATTAAAASVPQTPQSARSTPAPEETTPEYDYIRSQLFMERNAAYDNTPTVFTTYL